MSKQWRVYKEYIWSEYSFLSQCERGSPDLFQMSRIWWIVGEMEINQNIFNFQKREYILETSWDWTARRKEPDL